MTRLGVGHLRSIESVSSIRTPTILCPKIEVDEMDQDESFSALIGKIYDAALDHAQWPAVLEAVAGYAEGSGAALFSKNLTRSTVEIDCSVGIAIEFQRRYHMSMSRSILATSGNS